MAKSKAVKQQEALARKRSLFSQKFAQLAERRVGGKIYNDRLARWGLEKTKELEDQANKDFGLYLREARLDSHGNELVYGLKTFYSEDDSVLKGFMATSILRDLMPKRVPNNNEAIHDFLTDVGDQSFN